VTARSTGRRVAAGVLLTTVTMAVGLTPGGTASAAPGTDDTRASTPYETPAPEYVKDSYIVLFKDAKVSKDQVSATATRLSARFAGRVGHTYDSTVRGFSATMSADAAKRLAAEPEVERVEQVTRFRKSDTQTDPTWGLDRIDEYSLPLNRSYTYPGTASTVHAYVIDTGIRASHPEFQGRVTAGPDYVDDDNDADDCNGHGTHVAGTVGGQTYGVAKGVALHSVRVLDCNGNGNADDVLAAVNWVAANAIRPAVVNMSLGGPGSSAVDAAVTIAVASGLTFAVAAGNSGDNACGFSPGRVEAAITVGATDEIDYAASFSNFGQCLDIWAPGVDIRSAYIAGGSVLSSGTSMASPHVAGAAALLLAANPTWTPLQVADQLRADSSSSVHHAIERSPNALLNLTAASNERASLSLIARVNARFVSGAGPGGVLSADAIVPAATETFTRESTGGETFALKVGAMYVRLGAGARLEATAPDVASAERFTLTQNDDLSVGLRAANGMYVAAENAGAGALVANRSSIGAWETFEKQAPDLVVSVQAFVNERYVTADNAGAGALIANRTGIGTWEEFDIVETPDGFIGLRSHANGLYVSAENAGAGSLVANRTSIGPWEKFWFLHLGNGQVAIYALANGRLVSAEGAGAQPLKARTAYADLGEWEVFTRTTRIF
jgi:subtilisin family serine protease